MKPEIIVLCGIPCSGKSTWAKYQNEIHFRSTISRDHYRCVEGDGKYKFDYKLEDRVTEICNTFYKNYTSVCFDIIIDNTHCSEKYLDYEIKRKPEGHTLRIIFFDCPLWKAYYRNVIRYFKTGKWIPFSVIRNMKRNYDKIDKKKYDMVYQ